jgi:hypothetical protein
MIEIEFLFVFEILDTVQPLNFLSVTFTLFDQTNVSWHNPRLVLVSGNDSNQNIV